MNEMTTCICLELHCYLHPSGRSQFIGADLNIGAICSALKPVTIVSDDSRFSALLIEIGDALLTSAVRVM